MRKYRPVVVASFQRAGLAQEAEDLAQEVFLQLFETVLGRADRSRGRFRGLLFALSRQAAGHLRERRDALKRGGGAVQSLGERDHAEPCPEETFDREWVGRLLELALDRLEQKHPNYHQAVRLFLVEELTQDQVANRLGCSRQDIKNWVHRGRKKLIAYLRDEVWSTSTSQEDYAAELQLVLQVLGE